jgi:hypothetical protein
MADGRAPPRADSVWRSAFFGALGVVVAILLVVGVFQSLPPASSVQPPWPSTYPFGLGASGGIDPDSMGWGEGAGTNDSCLFLLVEFNASNPVELWVIPGGAGVVVQNDTPYFSSILWFSGAELTGKNAIELPDGGGYQVWTANPGPVEVFVFISQETVACS